jgi:Ca-activated chloride channel homolog
VSDPASAKRTVSLRLVIFAIGSVVAIGATFLIFQPSGTSNAVCTTRVPLNVNASTEKADLLRVIANEYNQIGRVFDGKCATVEVSKTTSGDAMEAIARGWDPKVDGVPVPQAWAPTTSLWRRLLEQRGKGDLVQGEEQSITRSVLVVAMPKPMADVLRANNGATLGWSDLLKLSTAPHGWASIPGAKPEWGAFKLARDNPHRSTSGLVATAATYYAATKTVTGKDPTPADLENPDVTSFVHGVESSVFRYGDDSTEFMGVLYDEDQRNAQAPPHFSAIVVQEQLAYLYNKGTPRGDPTQIGKGNKPNTPLVAIHPQDGTMKLDHPFLVLANASGDQRAAAADFRRFLREPEQQDRFTNFGFRNLNGAANDDLARTVQVDRNAPSTAIDPPSADLLVQMVKGWDGARRKARVLLVLDVSGSMNDPADRSAVGSALAEKSRLDLVKPAAVEGIKLLAADDEIGLWTFSTGEPLPYKEQVPIGRVADVRQRIIDVINGIVRGDGNTALFRTTHAAQKKMLATFDHKRINAVVLLSDGANLEPGHPSAESQSLDLLLSRLDAEQVENSVRVFTIPYGNADEGSHVETLAKIARASKAATYDASNPKDIGKVFVEVFRNL